MEKPITEEQKAAHTKSMGTMQDRSSAEQRG